MGWTDQHNTLNWIDGWSHFYQIWRYLY